MLAVAYSKFLAFDVSSLLALRVKIFAGLLGDYRKHVSLSLEFWGQLIIYPRCGKICKPFASQLVSLPFPVCTDRWDRPTFRQSKVRRWLCHKGSCKSARKSHKITFALHATGLPMALILCKCERQNGFCHRWPKNNDKLISVAFFPRLLKPTHPKKKKEGCTTTLPLHFRTLLDTTQSNSFPSRKCHSSNPAIVFQDLKKLFSAFAFSGAFEYSRS